MAVALTACGRGTPSAGADTTAMVTPPPAAAAEPPGTMSSSRTFNSLLADFQFAVPDAWEQRYTATERVNPKEFPRAKTVSEFMFLPMSGGTPPTLLSIVQYRDQDWKAISASPAKAPGTVVAEGGGRVLVAVPLEAQPFPAGSDDALAIAPMMVTAKQVAEGIRTQ